MSRVYEVVEEAHPFLSRIEFRVVTPTFYTAPTVLRAALVVYP